MNFLYVIQNDETLEKYIGITSNLEKRIREHNAGENYSTYRKNGKWILIYFEWFRNQNDTIAREKRLKNHGAGKGHLFKRMSKSLL